MTDDKQEQTPKNEDVPDGSGTNSSTDDENEAGEDTASGGPA